MDPEEAASDVRYLDIFAMALEDAARSGYVEGVATDEADLLELPNEEKWLQGAPKVSFAEEDVVMVDDSDVRWDPTLTDFAPGLANGIPEEPSRKLGKKSAQHVTGIPSVLEKSASDSSRSQSDQWMDMARSIKESIRETEPKARVRRQSSLESVEDRRSSDPPNLDSDVDFTSIHSYSPSSKPWAATTKTCSEPKTNPNIAVRVPECILLTPRSFYEPFDPPAPVNSERAAVGSLLPFAGGKPLSSHEFMELKLNEFAIYTDKALYGVEMSPLHHLNTKASSPRFFFDGVLSSGLAAYYVRGVPILALPVDNYGDLSRHTVRDDIWIRSLLNADREIYYRLGQPAKEYRRFWEPFLWVADLGKHFVDYMQVMGEKSEKVTISHFRGAFIAWLKSTHGDAPVFLRWLSQKPGIDFRTSVIANLGYLHKEAIGVLGQDKAYFHTFWDEVYYFERYTGPSEGISIPEDLSTIVTPYIYACFEHLPFGDRLKVIPMSDRTYELRNKLIQKRHLEMPVGLHEEPKIISSAPQDRILNIKPGDTISTRRDSEDSGTVWKREESIGFSDVDRWFALVQKVHKRRNGLRSFDVTWYYRPVDTLCGVMKYPWNNELFLSDHCSCREDAKITEDEVLGVHDVDFYGTSATPSELFCRQTYLHKERKWVSLEHSHRCCEHLRGASGAEPEYTIGDTYLVHLDRETDRSEPCELVAFHADSRKVFKWRKLLRRRDVDPSARTARPNELVYSDTFTTLQESLGCAPTKSAVMDRCHVRFFVEGQAIPTPYDRDGVGAYFYITHRQAAEEHSHNPHRYVAFSADAFPTSLRQGYDPSIEITKLRGLDLFCGGGNFGRGLEDGGGIKMHWANDYDCKAIHTYMANMEQPGSVSPFFGSIDVLQRLAIQGHFSSSVPEVGKVDFISGGSPCPGFSLLTNDKTTVAQRKNQSLVAAFASFVDLYRPRYGLLENVTGIVQKRHNRDQDVFSQLICAVVGLGYQTQFFFLDASACGSPQRRSRVFLAFAAPGCRLPRQPQQTHTHPSFTRGLTLGRLPYGEPMAERRMPAASPFKFVSALEATADLPSIHDAKPDLCVPFPDHRVSAGQTKKVRLATCHIPTRPFGTNFAQAWFGPRLDSPGSGVMTPSERASFFPPEPGWCTAKFSKAWGRQDPNRPIGTIVTRQSCNDCKSGRQLHWRENRLISIMEARRAQGFRDDDVLLGHPADQYRIIGNSVAREVALALGLSIREAWAETQAMQSRNSVTGDDDSDGFW
jgi:DNA (cytosine-5)-methyltransferase 1